jgi:hypothetical protein
VDKAGTLGKRFIASLDVLGFSNLVKQDVGRLYDAYWTSIKIVRSHEESAHFIPDHPGIVPIDGSKPPGTMVRSFPHIYEVAVFSDSMFIFTDDASDESLNDLCEFCISIYQVFLNRQLALRGAIVAGEAIVDREDKVYVGQGIIDAHNLEKSLDLTGIVLAEGLTPAASAEALVTFKEEKFGAEQKQKTMRVPTHRNSNGRQYAQNLIHIRIQSPASYTQRYRNSIPVVAAMIKADQNDLRLTTDPDYVPKDSHPKR